MGYDRRRQGAFGFADRDRPGHAHRAFWPDHAEQFSIGSVHFRKAYLQALIDVIEVDDHQIRIKGSKDLLEKAVLAGKATNSGCSSAGGDGADRKLLTGGGRNLMALENPNGRF